jgi:hypothetical protein
MLKYVFPKPKLQFFNTWIRIQIRIQNADQDPATQINKLMQILTDPDPGLGLLTQRPDKACLVKQIKVRKDNGETRRK